jgi:DNA-binding NarL/FixJ family response regulator
METAIRKFLKVPMTKISVLLVDDHAVLRSGLRMLLDNQEDIDVVGEAEDGVQAINEAQAHQPEVIVLDLSMPGMSGLDSLKALHSVSPNSRILVLTMHEDGSYLRRALREGAAGYIVKKAADAEVISAVRAVHDGDLYIHSSMTRDLLEDNTDIDPSRPTVTGVKWGDLSNREQEVLKLIAMGHTNAEAADGLSLSVKTIETYRSRGMEKLGLKTRASLVKYALERGLLTG